MTTNKAQKRKKTVEEDEEDDEPQETMDMSDEEGGVRVDGIYIPPPPKPACTVESTGPRLIITGINNYFFKSYAGEQILGPFHKCFNAIVGPNGSGKSNVIDAMLFVFGYRATKIRSKKISVLLHNSEHYSNVQSCTVSVHFARIVDKEGDAYDIVPGSEFIISRTAHKDSSSYYQINGRRVQFKDVAKLLRQHGVDLDHNRFLILQGEVEQIAMMKCKAQNEHETGMLEYLEDIIGTSRFKAPLVQLEERVEILADQRVEKLNRVKLVQKELNELKKPMEDAVEFLQLENSIILSKNFVCQWHICDLEKKIKETEEEKSEIAANQKELADELANIGKEKGAKEQTLKEACKRYEVLQKRNDKIKEAFDVANNKDIQLQADMTQLNKTRKKTKELLAEEQKRLAELERVPEANEKGIVECVAKEEQMTAKKEKLEAEKAKLLASLRSETQELQEQKETLQTELVDLNKVVDETKSGFALAESELKIYISNEENEKKKLEQMQTTYENIKETITQRTREVAELKKKIPLTEKSLNGAQQDLNSVKAKEAELIDQIRTRRTSLAETKSSMQATRSRGRVLDSLMKQKREGKCSGLFGRLGDLGAIDQKYDVAISTACGPLDNIVVDTVATAQWCIEFLKQHDIGRGTFIALDKQEHLRQRANSTIKTPENVPRLFDLIKIQDDRIRTAFYYAIRDTLVANDLDQASRIAYGQQRYRVVTLAGQLIETTGTMSGGGKSVSRGRMGQSVAVTNIEPKEIEHMEEQLQTLEEKVRQLRQKQTSFENQVNTLEPELKQMKINLEKFSIELQSSKQQEPILAKQLKAQEAKSKSTQADPATVKKLTKAVNDKKVKYDKAAAAAGEIQAQVDQLTAEIKDKTVGKMKTMDKNLKDTTNTIDKCKAEITRLKVGIKTAERNAKKSAEKIATMEQDITNAENNLRSMKAQREEIETDGEQLLKTIENIAGQLNEAEEECAGIKQEVVAFTKRENQIKSDKIEVDQKCKTFDKTINDKKGEIHQWRAKLSHLKLQEIPDQSMEELKTYTDEELKQRDIQNVQRELHYNEDQLKAAKPNLNAIAEYRKKQDVFIARSKELDELSQQKAKVKETLDSVRQRRKEEFLTGYNIIRMKLKEMYQMITLGGDADFEMVDTFDPFTEGIQFNVRPPKKSWKNISNLSGGEKTLSSLALVFALHYYKPSPLYVMDEIDAALDFKNVSIVGNYIKERTKNAQFIIISLRSNMFELCDYLIGIYKTFNCTKSICIDPRQYENKEKPTQDQPIPTQNQNGTEPNVNIEVPNINDAVSHVNGVADVEDEPVGQTNTVSNNNPVEDEPVSQTNTVSSSNPNTDNSESENMNDGDDEMENTNSSDVSPNAESGGESIVVESSMIEEGSQLEQMEVDSCS